MLWTVLLSLLSLSSRSGEKPTARPCVGSYPAVFDDFRYADEDDATTDPVDNRAGHLFGHNTWVRCDGARPLVYTTRAWYRNFATDGEGDRVDPLGRIVVRQASGTVGFRLETGYPSPGPTRHDVDIMLGFQARNGTYAARLLLDDIEPRTGVNQSFWAINDPGRTAENYSEMDFEWNDLGWHRPAGTESMNVTNWSAGPANHGQALTCWEWERGVPPDETSCSDVTATPRRYVVLIMRYRQGAVDFSMTSEREGHTLYGGGGPGTPLTLRERVPREWMRVILGTGMFRAVPPAPQRHTTRPHDLSADWFYFTPNETVSYSQIQGQVALFRSAGYSRVNTTGLRVCSLDHAASAASC